MGLACGLGYALIACISHGLLRVPLSLLMESETRSKSGPHWVAEVPEALILKSLLCGPFSCVSASTDHFGGNMPELSSIPEGFVLI